MAAKRAVAAGCRRGTRVARAVPVLAAAAILTISGLAGCGAFPPAARSPGMEKQISQGERVSAATRAQAARERAAGQGRAKHGQAAGRAGPGQERAARLGAGTAARAEPAPARRRVPGRQVTAIGDSVMLASALALRSLLPGIYLDARPSRQMPAGLAVVRGLARTGRLRPVVVVGLGTNYLVTAAQLSDLLRLLGPHRRLVLINTYENDAWSRQVNATDADFTRRHPEVVLADWYDTIKDRTSLLWPDQVHPQLPGTMVYARMVDRAVQATRRVPGTPPGSRSLVAARATAPPAGRGR